MFESVEVGLNKTDEERSEVCHYEILRDQRRETRLQRGEKRKRERERPSPVSILKITFLRLSPSQPRISHLSTVSRRPFRRA